MTRTVQIFRYPDHSPDAGELGFLCIVCQQGVRIHAAEPFAPQVRLFFDQHRHDGWSDASDPE